MKCRICNDKKELVCPACKGVDPQFGCARCRSVGIIACPKCAERSVQRIALADRISNQFRRKENRMFEKIDNFAMQWLETAKSGITTISEAMQAVYEFVFNLFWAVMALLIMVFTFPFWWLGKMRANR